MKKINLSIIAMILVFATLMIFSCSQEETSTEKTTNSEQQRIANPTVNDLKAEFVIIMKSSEYINLENNIKKIATGIRGNNQVPLDTKEAFTFWLTENLSKTNFTNTEEALKLYDDFLKYSDAYTNKFNDFYIDLNDGNFKASEIALILGPELKSPLFEVQTGPCQNYCMDECEANIDFLNNGYASTPNAWTPRGRLQYWISYTWIVGNYNDCLSSC
jgi:hypothetical protein